MPEPKRRFPQPLRVEETDAGFVVRDHNVATSYCEEEPGAPSSGQAAHPRRGSAHRRQYRPSCRSGSARLDLLRPPCCGGSHAHAHPNHLPQLRAYRRCHRRVASARADLLTMRTRRVHQERQTGEVAERHARRTGGPARGLGAVRGGVNSIPLRVIKWIDVDQGGLRIGAYGCARLLCRIARSRRGSWPNLWETGSGLWPPCLSLRQPAAPLAAPLKSGYAAGGHRTAPASATRPASLGWPIMSNLAPRFGSGAFFVGALAVGCGGGRVSRRQRAGTRLRLFRGGAGTARGGHPRRGPAHRRQHRQAAGAAQALGLCLRRAPPSLPLPG
jgi:hypothetical protein